ncbi:DUF4253 domain-containing protein [Cohnella sp.]|uniref:DUF4253 domain-containing protein n=1 Tax=Cohnella sp. TaxID=1883426 RepID=UPI003567C6B6
MDWKRIFGLGKKRENKTLSDEVAEEMGFSRNVLDIIKQISNANLQRLTVRNDEGEIEIDGISFFTFNEDDEKLIIELQSKLKPLECIVFFNDQEHCKVGIIKGQDQFEILKIQQTNGDNYDIGNKEVIAKLKKWNSRFPFDIIGADFDWVEANFKVMPDDNEIRSFAQEIYDFCPDIVDQGTGSIESLIEEIKKSKKLYLWWD